MVAIDDDGSDARDCFHRQCVGRLRKNRGLVAHLGVDSDCSDLRLVRSSAVRSRHATRLVVAGRPSRLAGGFNGGFAGRFSRAWISTWPESLNKACGVAIHAMQLRWLFESNSAKTSPERPDDRPRSAATIDLSQIAVLRRLQKLVSHAGPRLLADQVRRHEEQAMCKIVVGRRWVHDWAVLNREAKPMAFPDGNRENETWQRANRFDRACHR